MVQEFHPIGKGSGTLKPAGGITPLDVETGGAGAPIPVNAIVGVANFSFNFFNEGRTNNLLPGRPTTQTSSLQVPAGTTNGFIYLRSVFGAFVTNGNANLTERPLGQFAVDMEFGANNTRAVAVIMPNDQSVGADWTTYRVSVREIEKLSGYTFFKDILRKSQRKSEGRGHREGQGSKSENAMRNTIEVLKQAVTGLLYISESEAEL